jgi:hypothetical protein
MLCKANDTILISLERITDIILRKRVTFQSREHLVFVNDRQCCVWICLKTSYFIFAGAIGYMGTSAFVRKIYTNVKID